MGQLLLKITKEFTKYNWKEQKLVVIDKISKEVDNFTEKWERKKERRVNGGVWEIFGWKAGKKINGGIK